MFGFFFLFFFFFFFFLLVDLEVLAETPFLD